MERMIENAAHKLFSKADSKLDDEKISRRVKHMKARQDAIMKRKFKELPKERKIEVIQERFNLSHGGTKQNKKKKKKRR